MVRKPYPLPIIGDTIQHLEGSQYATAFDINMEYYTIRTFTDSKDMTTVVTEFGKFKYNCLPMVICAPGDIFQAKVDKLLGDIKGIKTCIDDILVLRKEILYKHIEQQRIIFGVFHTSGLKDNYPKYSFGFKEITYLGYVITREGET